jgi:hypothetical protein
VVGTLNSRAIEIGSSPISFSAPRWQIWADLRRRARRHRPGSLSIPAFTIRRFHVGAATDNPSFMSTREHFYVGTRKAGVPEG